MWVGSGWLDFDQKMIDAAIAHLKKWEKPHGRGDAAMAIANKIRDENWAWIEARIAETKGSSANESLEDVQKAIAQLLRDQNLNGLLPDQWQKSTGCLLPSELTLEQAQAYRDELSLRRAA